MTSPRFAILTISDRSARGERPDASGPALAQQVQAAGWQLLKTAIVPDVHEQIRKMLIKWCDSGEVDLILTTGGTGFAQTDVTPEATLSVVEREAPGIAEAIRLESLKITPHGMLSRAVAGIRSQTLIVNLPGSPSAAVEALAVILPVIPHIVELLTNAPTAENGHYRPNLLSRSIP